MFSEHYRSKFWEGLKHKEFFKIDGPKIGKISVLVRCLGKAARPTTWPASLMSGIKTPKLIATPGGA